MAAIVNNTLFMIFVCLAKVEGNNAVSLTPKGGIMTDYALPDL
jgi:hypothetical protein